MNYKDYKGRRKDPLGFSSILGPGNLEQMHGGVPGASIPLLWDHLAEEHLAGEARIAVICVKRKSTGQSSKQSL